MIGACGVMFIINYAPGPGKNDIPVFSDRFALLHQKGTGLF